MKKIIAIACLTLIISNAFSQKCKYKYDKVDPISGEKEQRITIDCNMIHTIAFYRKGNDYRMESYIMMRDKQTFVVAAGSKLDIKLTNGKIVSLKSVTDVTPALSVDASATIRSDYAMTYSISKEELNDIQVYGISFIRTYLQSGTQYYDYTMKEKKVEKTKESAGCMLVN